MFNNVAIFRFEAKNIAKSLICQGIDYGADIYVSRLNKEWSND